MEGEIGDGAYENALSFGSVELLANQICNDARNPVNDRRLRNLGGANAYSLADLVHPSRKSLLPSPVANATLPNDERYRPVLGPLSRRAFFDFDPNS
jgi:hypothetical protein